MSYVIFLERYRKIVRHASVICLITIVFVVYLEELHTQ